MICAPVPSAVVDLAGEESIAANLDRTGAAKADARKERRYASW
jgi:hypothetical protein